MGVSVVFRRRTGKGRASNGGFSLLWTMVYVVILSSVVSAALVWSRYVLRVGGLGEIRDERNLFQSQAAFDQTALSAMQSAAQQATVQLYNGPLSQLFAWLTFWGASLISKLTGSSLQFVTTNDLINAINSLVIPSLQKQEIQATILYTYQVSYSTTLQNQIQQLQNLANALSQSSSGSSSEVNTLLLASYLLQAVLALSPNYMQPHAVIQVQQGSYAMVYDLTYVFTLRICNRS